MSKHSSFFRKASTNFQFMTGVSCVLFLASLRNDSQRETSCTNPHSNVKLCKVVMWEAHKLAGLAYEQIAQIRGACILRFRFVSWHKRTTWHLKEVENKLRRSPLVRVGRHIAHDQRPASSQFRNSKCRERFLRTRYCFNTDFSMAMMDEIDGGPSPHRKG